jgi:hypothetical protein
VTGPVRAATVDTSTDALAASSAPPAGVTNRHAVSATQASTSGTGAAVYAETTNANTAALVVRGPGPLIDLQDRAGRSIMQVGQAGFAPSSLAVSGAVTAGSVASTGAVTAASVAATGAVTGASAALTGAVTAASVASSGALSGTTIAGTGNCTITSGNLVIATAGKGLQIKSGGAAATVGTLTLNGVTPVVVSTTAVTATSLIFLTVQSTGGTPSGIAWVSARSAGVSFSVVGIALDNSVVGWQIVEPT